MLREGRCGEAPAYAEDARAGESEKEWTQAMRVTSHPHSRRGNMNVVPPPGAAERLVTRPGARVAGGFPLSRSALLLALLVLPLAGCADRPLQATAQAPAPSACVLEGCAVVAATGFHAEPWAALDPTRPGTAVVATFGNMGGWGSWVFLSTTRDGGRSWTVQPAPPVAGDPLAAVDSAGAFPARPGGAFVDHRPIAADTMAAFTPAGEALVVALVGRSTYAQSGQAFAAARPSDVVLWRSADGGASWTPGEVVVPARGAVAFTSAGRVDAGSWHDKPLLVADPATGEVHLFYNDVGASGVQLFALRSADGGGSWTEPALVKAGVYGASAAALNGTLLLTARNPGYQVLASTDAGRSWTARGKVGDWPGPTTTWQAAPVALWDSPHGVEALLARAEGPDGGRVVLQRSLDLGASWSAPVLVLPEAPSAKRNPVLAVDPATGNGVLAAYQGTPGKPDALETWAAVLTAGAPGAPLHVSTRTASAGGVYEYFAAAAGPDGGLVAYASPGPDGAPLHAVALAWP